MPIFAKVALMLPIVPFGSKHLATSTDFSKSFLLWRLVALRAMYLQQVTLETRIKQGKEHEKD